MTEAKALPPMPPPPGPGTLGPRPTDEARRAEIAKVRRRATSLLVIAAVVFLVTGPLEARWWWLGFIRATAEAAMVGGLADWFAVTALFRQPMGIPIPHTAIIKRQKDRIARVLGNFIRQHFLTREVISRRLHALEPARRVGAWLADPAESRELAERLSAGVAKSMDALPVDRWRARLVEEGVQLVTRAVQGGESGVDETLREQIRLGAPRWVPTMVQDALHRRLMAGLQRYLGEVATNRSHPAREQLDKVLGDAIDRFRRSVETPPAGVPAMRALPAAGAEGAAPAVDGVAGLLQSIGLHLEGDERARQELEDRLTDTVASLVESHGDAVAKVIEDTVASWDPDLAAERIELAVGRDLQFIRMNGTIVGGLAGLALYSLSLLF